MTVQAIRLAKTSKTFYRNSFRKVILLLFFSLILNGLFAFGIYNQIIHLKEPFYYSTNGITPPKKLNPLTRPNNSSKALLDPAPVLDDGEEMMNYG